MVGDACDGLQAVQRTTELQPDVVHLDMGMPMVNGIEAARRIQQLSPDSRGFEPSSLAQKAIFIKSNLASALLPAVEAVLQDHRGWLDAACV